MNTFFAAPYIESKKNVFVRFESQSDAVPFFQVLKIKSGEFRKNLACIVKKDHFPDRMCDPPVFGRNKKEIFITEPKIGITTDGIRPPESLHQIKRNPRVTGGIVKGGIESKRQNSLFGAEWNVLAEIERQSVKIEFTFISVKETRKRYAVHSSTRRISKHIAIIEKESCCESKEIRLFRQAGGCLII